MAKKEIKLEDETVEINMKDLMRLMFALEILNKYSIKNNPSFVLELGMPDQLWGHLCHFHNQNYEKVKQFVKRLKEREAKEKKSGNV